MIKARTHDIALAIYEATLDKKGAELNAVLENVAKFLLRNRLLNKKEEIIKKFEDIKDEREGVILAKITSKHKLKKENHTEILHFIKHYYKAKDATVEEEIDESLIGGVKIRVGDEVIDTTFKNQLAQLEDYLLKY